MTCEVAVANRLGIALAADSAVTFTSAVSNGATYATGANKIFQLSEQDPVAAMVFNDAGLNRIPWEVILKAYRRRLGRNSFPTLNAYVDDLVSFINADRHVLPDALRERATADATAAGVFHALDVVLGKSASLVNPATPVRDLQAEWSSGLAALQAKLAAASLPPSLEQQDLDDALLKYGAQYATELPAYITNAKGLPHLVPIVSALELAELGVKYAFLLPEEALPSFTGVVLAGFGADEFMPSFACVHITSFIGSRIHWSLEKSGAVNFTSSAALIESFAQKAMVETFTQGASPEVWTAVGEAFVDHARKVCENAAQAAGVTIAPSDIDAAVAANMTPFTKGWAYATFEAHLRPLKSAIAGLNVEELAELAETLVLLESLKEKVTSRTQSVGGPIDVAIITKSEGLVWIKRKHYFDPALNQRYLNRLR